jgi:uncharacterized protein
VVIVASIELPSRPPQEASKSAAQSLCLTCGLCCDGTLFSHVKLESDDNDAALALDIQTVGEPGPRILKQHCPTHKNCSCQIYQNRPNACRNFQCALLKRFNKHEISQAAALKIIRDATTLRDEVKESMRSAFGENNYSFDEFTVRLKTRWKDADSLEARDRVSELFRKFAILWLCINKHFRHQWQR